MAPKSVAESPIVMWTHLRPRLSPQYAKRQQITNGYYRLVAVLALSASVFE